MCDIWKDTTHEELSLADLERHLKDIRELNVRWVVFSGGEPLMHSDLFRLSSLIRSLGIRSTLLTTGLLLERHANRTVDSIDDVIVSLDGPESVHDTIRRVPGAFGWLRAGINAIHQLNPAFPVSARSTIQKLNYHLLRETARSAYQLGCRSISFLPVDLSSDTFNRSGNWDGSEQRMLALSEDQICRLEVEVRGLMTDWADSRFVLEDAHKFDRIIHYFRAQIGLAEFIAPQCNAPWVSAVLQSDGQVRPCFFHKPIGNVKAGGLAAVINGFEALSFRTGLRIASDPICKRCVCSLNWTGTL